MDPKRYEISLLKESEKALITANPFHLKMKLFKNIQFIMAFNEIEFYILDLENYFKPIFSIIISSLLSD